MFRFRLIHLSLPLLVAGILIAPLLSQQTPPPGAPPQAGRGGRGAGRGPQRPARKQLLAIGDNHTGFQHESTSHALAVIERIGYESGAYDTTIKTDTQLVTKGDVSMATASKRSNAHNIDWYDAVFYYGAGEDSLTDKQKADLLAFIHDDGKGFVGAHNALNSFYTWPEYGEMIGAYFDNHPWGTFDAPIIVEDPAFPAMKAFPREFVLKDEIFEPKMPYSRDKVRVLARLDVSKLDFTREGINRKDKDFPVAWAKMYGKGRVFYSTFGHTNESWDNPEVQKMWLEAIKWSMGMTDADVTPRPLPADAK